MCLVKRDHQKCVADIQGEIFDQIDSGIFKRTGARRLVEPGLHDLISRKKLLVNTSQECAG